MMDRTNECKSPPCANCGKERGGNMFAPYWGHSFNCCSEKCGREFARIHDKKARTPEGRKWLAEKWEWLESQCNYRLTGKPFQGYPDRIRADELEARARIAAERERELAEALRWYQENARRCRLIHRDGDEGRAALAADGGERARKALAAYDEREGEK